MRLGGRSTRLALWAVCLAVALAAVPSLSAQPQYVGPNKCLNCHDHEDEKAWWQDQDGPPPNGHINALDQLELENTTKYAEAVGLADPYDVGGSCVPCHSTVYKGEPLSGVSCESCHGPGSDYLDIHQEGVWISLGLRA